MTDSSSKPLDVSFEKNEFSLVSNSFINTKEYNKELNDFEFNESTYKNMIHSLEKIVHSQEQQYESKIINLNQTIESLQHEIVILNEVLSIKEKEISNFQASKEYENDPYINCRSLLNRSTLSENNMNVLNECASKRKFERDWSGIKTKENRLFCYIKKKVDTNLSKRESNVRKHAYANISRIEDKSIINTISLPKKESTLQRLNKSDSKSLSDWETRWERKWLNNELKEVEESRNLLKELDVVYNQQINTNKNVKKDCYDLKFDFMPLKTEVLEIEKMITNMNKNKANLENKINKIIAEKNNFKQLNYDLTQNITYQQKIIKDYENMLNTSYFYAKECTDINYNLTSLFQKLININGYSKDIIVTIEDFFQRNKIQPKIDKLNVILMALKQNYKEKIEKNNKLFIKKTPSVKFSPRFHTSDDESNKENINFNNEDAKESQKIRSVSEFKQILNEDNNDKIHLKYEELEKKCYLLNEEKSKLENELNNLKKSQELMHLIHMKGESKSAKKNESDTNRNNNTLKKSKDLLNFMKKIDEKNSNINLFNAFEENNIDHLYHSDEEKNILVEDCLKTKKAKDSKKYQFNENYEDLQKKYNLLVEKNSELENNFNNLKQNTEYLNCNELNKNNIDDYIEKNKCLIEQNTNLKAELENTQDILKTYKNNFKNNDAMDKKYLDLVEQYSTLESELNCLKIMSNDNSYDNLEQKYITLLEQNSRLENELNELKETQSSLLSMIQNKEESMETNQNNYEQLKKKYLNLQEEFSNMEKESEVLKNAQGLLLNLIRNKEDKIDDLDKKFKSLNEEKQKFEKEVKSFKDSEIASQEIKNQFFSLSEEYLKLQNLLKDSNEVINTMNKNLIENKRICDEIEKKKENEKLLKEDFEKKYKVLMKENADLLDNEKTMKEIIDAKNQEENNLLKDLNEIKNVNQKFEKQLLNLTKESKGKDEEINILHNQKNILQNQKNEYMTHSKEKISNLIEENAKLGAEIEILKNNDHLNLKQYELFVEDKNKVLTSIEKKSSEEELNGLNIHSTPKNNEISQNDDMDDLDEGKEKILSLFAEKKTLLEELNHLKKQKGENKEMFKQKERKNLSLSETELKVEFKSPKYHKKQENNCFMMKESLLKLSLKSPIINEFNKDVCLSDQPKKQSFISSEIPRKTETEENSSKIYTSPGDFNESRYSFDELERKYWCLYQEKSKIEDELNLLKKYKNKNEGEGEGSSKIFRQNESYEETEKKLMNIIEENNILVEELNNLKLQERNKDVEMRKNLEEINEQHEFFVDELKKSIEKEKIKSLKLEREFIDIKTENYEIKLSMTTTNNKNSENESKIITLQEEKNKLLEEFINFKNSIRDKNLELEKKIMEEKNCVINQFENYKGQEKRKMMNMMEERNNLIKELDQAEINNFENEKKLMKLIQENDSLTIELKSLREDENKRNLENNSQINEIIEEAENLETINPKRKYNSISKDQSINIKEDTKEYKTLDLQQNALNLNEYNNILIEKMKNENSELENKLVINMQDKTKLMDQINALNQDKCISMRKLNKLQEEHQKLEKSYEYLKIQIIALNEEQNSRNSNQLNNKIITEEVFEILIMELKNNNYSKKFELIPLTSDPIDIIKEDISNNDIDNLLKKIKIDHKNSKNKITKFYENLILNLILFFSNCFENIIRNGNLIEINYLSLDDFVHLFKKTNSDLQTKFQEFKVIFEEFKGYLNSIGQKEVEWLNKLQGEQPKQIEKLNIFWENYQNLKYRMLESF